VDLRLGSSDEKGSYWTVMADIAIAMFIVLVLYIIAQYLRDFERIAIAERLEARQDSVQLLVLGSLSDDFAEGVRIESVSPDAQRITFSADVLFAVCRDDLRPRGTQLLREVGSALSGVQGYFAAIQVDGHTDVIPIATRGGCPYESNWELSSARATTVVRLFTEQAAITPERLSAVGWSEFHPVDSLALDPNRRIEVTLRYDREAVRRELYGPSASTP
jgi:flagellar motor protein MotB